MTRSYLLRRSSCKFISVPQERLVKPRSLRLALRRRTSVTIMLLCVVIVWALVVSKMQTKAWKNFDIGFMSTGINSMSRSSWDRVHMLGVDFEGEFPDAVEVGRPSTSNGQNNPPLSVQKSADTPSIDSDPPSQDDTSRLSTDTSSVSSAELTQADNQVKQVQWQRAPLTSDQLSNANFTILSPNALSPVGKFALDVTGDRETIFAGPKDVEDAAKITAGLKIYVAPTTDHSIYCLQKRPQCDNTLGCWDKRLWLFAREAFSDVKASEADFVLMPYFHYCFFYSEGCYATINRRKADSMDVLSFLYNHTMNHLEEVAPNRNWTQRLLVPLSHDFGGCVRFAFNSAQQKQRIKGQPELLKDSIVLAAMGDHDTSCHIPGKDIVMPAYIDHYSLNEKSLIKSSNRQYTLYFGGTVEFDLRRPGIRSILLNPQNYKHLDQHRLGYFAPRANYSSVLHNTVFCIGPPGVVGWTGRVWEALWAGCIPVFLSESTEHPWEDFVQYNKFSVMLNYSDAENIEELLENITPEQRDRLQEEGQRVREIFIYRLPYTQERGPFSFLFKTLRRRKKILDMHELRN
eukprot:Plantae.Rhodophyta-Purpureofilum_apyrenoidigerum.ctg3650.p1 GENE.Plantae.Rhodophyta-Purpureofilum_apyrenoidigerum.ctg3650~~Plantae.Rhodophyta-Purpureofilum_apyrenoidigerum.ctg3650.p1  ORF type:complete len:574 (+),score=90.91 Plantae.Rhodophyta-Purpureofilum_apyrenoidigerum.ctg3650:142-1863(+)